MSQADMLLPPFSVGKMESLVGVSEEALAPIVENWIHGVTSQRIIVVAKNEKLAAQWTSDLAYFPKHARPESATSAIVHFPENQLESEEADTQFDAGSERIAALMQRNEGIKPLVWVATPKALAQPVPAPSELSKRQLTLISGSSVPFEELATQLLALDYDSEGLCEAPGQFAKRGGIIDIYPITADKPYRIDFFGDTIESIRELDPVTQRSGKPIDEITVSASPFLEMPEAPNGLLDHLEGQVAWCLVEPDDLLLSMREQSDKNLDIEAFWIRLRKERSNYPDRWACISDLDLGSSDETEPVAYEAESLAFYRPQPDALKVADERLADEQAVRIRFLDQLGKWHKNGEQLVFILRHQSESGRLKEMLDSVNTLKEAKPTIWIGDLNQGCRIHFRSNLGKIDWPLLKGSNGLVLVTETELFGRRRKRSVSLRQKALVSQSQVDQLLDFATLVEGEFVVHLQHGIALYRGIVKVDIQGQLREALSLEFDEGMILYVPLQESHLISRYVGLAKTSPKLGALGSNRWSKTREAAERSTLDLAAKLLSIQAKRDSAEGFAFSSDTEWQKEFEGAFPFTETPDQMQAIVDSKGDMEKDKPMDRLICGDVGYGKTEVALRAAFKAVMDGKQVAILVPTTVLAQQHFLNFQDRMASYPIVVELASRFRKPGAIKKILQSLKEGKVDILIGTHRLISKDVHFKDLGLVVIDEEQRFGVKHKEVFKQWRETVDILTMSATPIPRTLYMALTGARELSVIETPPQERKPIQTIVRSYDDKLVSEVIRREITRGGQVFYLHNRVQTIDTVASKLRQLMPEISFGVGHGQMDEKQLEEVMIDFVDGRYQALVCTTIIESGLDIPNCNTIIIEGADRFGLSQLYQLRGRVGRFKRQAYAYLLLHKHQRVMDIARKRLQAIRQHNQLGAGFRIAMRDLELRGAGNLLGPEQSGHIVGVGFELYCQLLKQSIARLKGEPIAQAIRANVKLDFIYQGEGELDDSNRYEDGYTTLKRLDMKEGECEPMQARIPATYLDETRLRIDMYRRLAMAETPAQVRELGEAMKDRFGTYPEEVSALLALAEIRCLAESKGIFSIESSGNRLKCRIRASSGDEFLKLGTRFPRLQSKKALKRLGEIQVFLRNYRPQKDNFVAEKAN